MDRPLEIAFHGLQGSPALEQEIRDHVAKLERRRKLVSCRVTLEADGGKHRPNHHVNVHIILGLPGRDITITHNPHHEEKHRHHPDAYTAVRDAFHIVERQLDHLKS